MDLDVCEGCELDSAGPGIGQVTGGIEVMDFRFPDQAKDFLNS
jgi:hypothetical protein